MKRRLDLIDYLHELLEEQKVATEEEERKLVEIYESIEEGLKQQLAEVSSGESVARLEQELERVEQQKEEAVLSIRKGYEELERDLGKRMENLNKEIISAFLGREFL